MFHRLLLMLALQWKQLAAQEEAKSYLSIAAIDAAENG
jgi:hypothetical protein